MCVAPSMVIMPVYSFGPFHINSTTRILTRAGQPVPLTPRALELLLVLLERQGAIVSKDELLQRVWPDLLVEENSIYQNVAAVRRALGEKPGENRFVVTVPGRGYSFVAPLLKREIPAAEDSAPSMMNRQSAPARTTNTGAPGWERGFARPRSGAQLLWLALCLGLLTVAVLAWYYWRRQDRAVIQTSPRRQPPGLSTALISARVSVAIASAQFIGLGTTHTSTTSQSGEPAPAEERPAECRGTTGRGSSVCQPSARPGAPAFGSSSGVPACRHRSPAGPQGLQFPQRERTA